MHDKTSFHLSDEAELDLADSLQKTEAGRLALHHPCACLLLRLLIRLPQPAMFEHACAKRLKSPGYDNEVEVHAMLQAKYLHGRLCV